MQQVRHEPDCAWAQMQKDEVAEWVIRTLKKAGISYAKASRSLGLPTDAISKVARGERDLSATEMAQIAELAGGELPATALETGPRPRYVPVLGEVAAGLWRDVGDFVDFNYSILSSIEARWPANSVCAYKVVGESINLRAGDGDHVIVLSRDQAPRGLQSGDWVVVERTRHDLRERTVKIAKMNSYGDWELWPQSSDPRFKDPILLGQHDGEIVEVVGFVLEFVSKGVRF